MLNGDGISLRVQPLAPALPPRELVWTLSKEGRETRVNLIEHGEYGWELQCTRHGQLVYGRLFALRSAAEAEAAAWRARLEAKGWHEDTGTRGQPPALRPSREIVWTLTKSGLTARAEIVNRGEFGYEMQLLRDGALFFGRLFPRRSGAEAEAAACRAELERWGWH